MANAMPVRFSRGDSTFRRSMLLALFATNFRRTVAQGRWQSSDVLVLRVGDAGTRAGEGGCVYYHLG